MTQGGSERGPLPPCLGSAGTRFHPRGSGSCWGRAATCCVWRAVRSRQLGRQGRVRRCVKPRVPSSTSCASSPRPGTRRPSASPSRCPPAHSPRSRCPLLLLALPLSRPAARAEQAASRRASARSCGRLGGACAPSCAPRCSWTASRCWEPWGRCSLRWGHRWCVARGTSRSTCHMPPHKIVVFGLFFRDTGRDTRLQDAPASDVAVCMPPLPAGRTGPRVWVRHALPPVGSAARLAPPGPLRDLALPLTALVAGPPQRGVALLRAPTRWHSTLCGPAPCPSGGLGGGCTLCRCSGRHSGSWAGAGAARFEGAPLELPAVGVALGACGRRRGGCFWWRGEGSSCGDHVRTGAGACVAITHGG